MKNNKKIIAVLPAYNAEKTLKQTYNDIPKDWVDKIILVDDASTDNTVAVAQQLKLLIFVHKNNLGYGGNQKTCYREALKAGGDVMVMIHPDHQYDPVAIPALIQPILDGKADAVFGSRMMIREHALGGGMPYWKYIANIFLTRVENYFLQLRLTEYHSGFRAYSRDLLSKIEFEKNSNNFVFDTEIIVQIKLAQMRILEVPIQTYYFPDASMIGFSKSVQYGMSIFLVLMRYALHRFGIKHYPQFMLCSQ